MTYSSCIYVFLVPVIVFLYSVIVKRPSSNQKNRRPPGPTGIPILGHFHLLGNNPPRNLHLLAQKHGPIMQMDLGSVPTVIASSPAAAELFLKTHDLVFCDRPSHRAAEYVTYGQKNIVFSRYGPYWRDMRKLCIVELLSNFKINQFQSMRNAEVAAFVRSIKEAADGTREAVDVGARIAKLTSDITCKMVVGRKISDDGDLNGLSFAAVITETMQVSGSFSFGDYLPILGKLHLGSLARRLKYLSSVLDGVLEKIIAEHVRDKSIDQEKKQATDFVDTMLNILESGKAGFQFDRTHIKAVLIDMLLAGMDTASSSIEWGLSEVIRNPNVMKKLQKELKEVVGLDQVVQESHLPKLEYLSWIVKETLRLHPPAPLVLHEAMNDCEVDRFFISKNSRVVVNIWSVGRDPSAWPDPEKFSPERFNGNKIELRGHDFELIPFGSGRRGCPGLQLGLTMFQLVLAQLVHCFDWELPGGVLPQELDMTEKFGIVTSRANHLMAIPKYRLAN